MDGTVYSFERNTKTGTLTEIQRISLFPPSTMNDNLSSNIKDNTIKVADIHITPDGKWLYVSERATNTITAFLLMITQVSLTYIGGYNTEKTPREFNIDPTGNFVISVGQDSDHLSVYAINSETGELKLVDGYESGKEPNWIEIVELTDIS